jgi:hypothetical protein
VSNSPWVAVIDDGELEDIRGLLDEMGIEFAHWGKASVPPGAWEPQQMLLTTAWHAASLHLNRPVSNKKKPRPQRAVWIAVLTTCFRTQRRLLLQAGFDFLVQRPVHPSALRHLFQRALYGGQEQRRGGRVAVGYGVMFRAGMRWRKGTLVDLSPRGCRILSHHDVSKGTRITVQLPSEIADGTPFDLRGKVVRVRQGEIEGGAPEETSIAVSFNPLRLNEKDRLLAILIALSSGPASLPTKKGETQDSGPSPDESSAGPKPGPLPDRRQPRAAYTENVTPAGYEDYAFQARDLSRGGLRLSPDPALAVGASLRLIIESGNDPEPIVVGARVVRDDGEHGIALQFEWIEQHGEARLDALVAALPPIESLR